ncbi:MAG: CoB--CoM heterodisulfide reductase iron-sulfur subunit A family protein, partial [Deltaproteobacteria bacterium]|nr:CoB--CoM heterodisulfide reductase iron-sulfur subunit A family protein [Deltaproteobacteria bacterium]
EMANIRNQDSWVHRDDPRSATEKAKDLVRMAVAKVALLEPLSEIELPMNPATLVLGGGIAGMVAARTLAQQGYEVHLVERTPQLGGQANSLYRTWKGEDIGAYVTQLAGEVSAHPLIHLHLSTELADVKGFVGNFTSSLKPKGKEEIQVEHGVAVIATGAREYQPAEYLYGQDQRVVTQMELDGRFLQGDPVLKELRSVAFIQCVGSRNGARPYCSRVCCTHSLRNALELKRRNPDIAVHVLFRDMRTYGMREDLYRQARQEGILFYRYDPEDPPRVDPGDRALELRLTDPILDLPIRIHADLLVLATAVVAENNVAIARFFKVPLGDDGFFQEAHAKLRPVDFSTDGVFLCGMAHYPKPLDESIAQAMAAASRAAGLLSAGRVNVSGTVAETDPALCARCGVCISICPFKAPAFAERGHAEINPALCKGCGLCMASCRSGAIHLKGYDDSQIMAMINEI